MSVKTFSLIFLGVAVAGIAIFATVAIRYHRPNVLLILLDTVRADHLGAFGYQRDTSPTLDAFLRENWNFNNALAAAPWTPASVASIFTGLYATGHGFMPPNKETDGLHRRGSRLSGAANTLAEVFGREGYFSAAVVANPWLKKGFGLNQGFKGFWHLNRGDAKEVNEKTFRVLRRLKEQEKPFFLYLHYMDPHTPYTPPPPYDSLYNTPLHDTGYSDEMQKRIALYDGEIRYLDDRLGELFEELKKLDLWEDLIVAVVSDHGEQFQEHGQEGHGFNLQNEEIHVVFGIKAPGRRGQETAVVSLVDVFPTVLELAQEPIPENIDGVSLVSRLKDRIQQPVISEIKRLRNIKSLSDQGQKRLILEYGMEKNADMNSQEAANPETMLLYDLSRDYFGQTPLGNPGDILSLKRLFLDRYANVMSHQIKSNTAEHDKLDADTLNELRSVGYF